MADRRREPDHSVKGDANVPDFLAQQQGASDLADFALQSWAGAGIGDAVAVETESLRTPHEDNLDITLSGGTLSVTEAVVDPAGASKSLLATPSGSDFSLWFLFPPEVVTPRTFLHIKGGVQYHHVATPALVQVITTWYDSEELGFLDVIGNTVTTIGYIGATLSDTWVHVDTYIAVPDGAVAAQSQVFWAGAPPVPNFLTTELLYLNNFSITPASKFPGVVSGRVSPRAAWWLPWGILDYDTVAASQAGIGAGTTVVTNLSVVVDTQVEGRTYEITVELFGDTFSATTNGWHVVVRKDGTNLGRVGDLGNVNAVNNEDSMTGSCLDVSPAIGVHTYDVTLTRVGGAGSFALGGTGSNSSRMWVKDIGPSMIPLVSDHEPPPEDLS